MGLGCISNAQYSHGRRLYVTSGEDAVVAALDKDTGDMEWRRVLEEGSKIYASEVVKGHLLTISGSSAKGIPPSASLRLWR
ncbi:unnamed protein product [Chrysoparadoxa australica]